MIRCPECEQTIALPDKLVSSGVEKAHCVSCGARFSVLPGGHTILLSGNPSGGTLPVGLQPAGAAETPNPPRSPSDVAAPNFSIQGAGPGQGLGNAAGTSPRLLDAPELEIGRHFYGKYRIDAVIGRGGSATVYRAYDVHAYSDCALKVVGVVGNGGGEICRAWAEEYSARRQVADGTHLLRLESPLVEEIDGTTYVALPQELGEITLREWLADARGEIETHRDEALRLLAQVCRGVESLHERGLAHLDLKPENVLLFDDGGQWTAKVGDFGLARAAGGLQRREGVGTPQYMAPEQVRAAREKDIGPWSDIYALGCMLYELLDGDRPFSGTVEELKDKHLNMAPSELEGVPSYLEQLVMACLAKARKERPDTVSEIKRGVETNPAEEAALTQARKSGTIAGWQSFLDQWGGDKYKDEAREALRKLELERREKERQERARKKREREERERKERERKEKERQEQERKEQERREREEAARRARQQAQEARRREQRRILEPVDIHGWDADRVQERQRKQAEALGMPVVFRDHLDDGGFGPEMVFVPSGIYWMGTLTRHPSWHDRAEYSDKKVELDAPFAIGRYALMFSEWDCFAELTNSRKPDDYDMGRGARPVVDIHPVDARKYLEWLSQQAPALYRLPLEEEWEYACRAGSTSWFNVGDQLSAEDANFDDVVGATAAVGAYPPNQFGLYEMHGNVQEWTNSRYGECSDGSVLSASVLRGGSFCLPAAAALSCGRNTCCSAAGEDSRGDDTGFRVLRKVV